MIVKIIETDFTPRNYFWMLCKASEFIEMSLRYFYRFVRMNSDCRVNPFVLLRKRKRRIKLFGARTRPNRNKRRNSCRPRAFEHCIAVFRKLRKVYVGVRVDQFHCVVSECCFGAEWVHSQECLVLLKTRADFDVFVRETREDRATFGADRSGNDHAV